MYYLSDNIIETTSKCLKLLVFFTSPVTSPLPSPANVQMASMATLVLMIMIREGVMMIMMNNGDGENNCGCKL